MPHFYALKTQTTGYLRDQGSYYPTPIKLMDGPHYAYAPPGQVQALWKPFAVLVPPVLTPEFTTRFMFRLKEEQMFPDIYHCSDTFPMVSERARDAILKLDDPKMHVFVPTEIQDTKKRRINKEDYFCWQLRRHVYFEKIEREKLTTLVRLDVDSGFDAPLVHLTNNPVEFQKIIGYPFWHRAYLLNCLVLNEDALQGLRSIGLSGLKDYSTKGIQPKTGESIERIDDSKLWVNIKKTAKWQASMARIAKWTAQK
jgi:hypothetical protein